MPIYDKKHYPLYMTKKPYKQVQYNCGIKSNISNYLVLVKY